MTCLVLMVEDDPRSAALVAAFLEREGYRVDVAHDATAARALAAAGAPYALYILDLMLPDGDGIQLARELVARRRAPVLMVTAIDEEMQEVMALDAGIDDYLAKPLQPHRLLARMRALLRRHSAPATPGGARLLLDEARREARLDGVVLDLSGAEYDLLALLVQRASQVVSRDELVRALRGFDYDGSDRSIDMRISALRRKLGDDGPPYAWIRTVRGTGYLLAEPGAE